MKTYLLTLLLCGLYSNLISQQDVQPSKGIIENGYLYYCHTKNDFCTLTRQKINNDEKDSFLISLTAKLLFNDPNDKWDISDGSIYFIRRFNGSDGMENHQLRHYCTNKLIWNERNKEYSGGEETFITNNLPINMFFIRYFYQEDSLNGPLFFDMSRSNDSVFLYVYVEDMHQMLIYKLTNSQTSSICEETEKTQFNPLKGWTRISIIPLELDSPFMVFQLKSKTHFITENGFIYLMDNKKLKKEGQLPDKTDNSMIITDKDNNEIYFISKSKLFEKSNLTIQEKLVAYARKIF